MSNSIQQFRQYGLDSVFAILVALPIGLIGAGFLYALEWVTINRLSHGWLLFFLPIGGFAVGWLYYHTGNGVEKGNNLIIDEIEAPKKPLPLLMAPLVVLGTLITHLFGGSAGREGTAVQIGAVVADAFGIEKLAPNSRRIVLLAGLSAGFAAVFGTPFAACIFAVELVAIGRFRWRALLPCLLAATAANEVGHLLGAPHVDYSLAVIPNFEWSSFPVMLFFGGLCGLVAFAFIRITHFLSNVFSTAIAYPPLRPLVGGVLLIGLFLITDGQKYMGLGIQEILDSFSIRQEWWVFLIKMAATAITIGAGFKGGEVTPLFFIGATLGSALSGWLPAEMYLLAAVGFVGVFAGATHTPLACLVMAMELFGWGIWSFAALVCVTSYFTSGQSSIYTSQNTQKRKYNWLKRWPH